MKYDPFGCPIRFGLGTFGDKWSLLIIRDIMFKGRSSYGSFLKAGEGVSTSVLASRLEQLETQGIIHKSRDPEHGKKWIYGLTQKGLELMDIMLEIMDWSEKYDPKTEVPPDFINRLRNDKQGLKEDLIQALKA